MTTEPPRLAAPPEIVDEDPPIGQLMSTRLIGITSDAPLSTALRLMASTGLRHLPVVEGDQCRGIVLEADLARFVAVGAGATASRVMLTVRDMTRRVIPLPVTARRSDAARRMQADRLDAALVIDQGQLIGIVTATDLVRSLANTAAREQAQPAEDQPRPS